MLHSFNKFSISALTAPTLYISVKRVNGIERKLEFFISASGGIALSVHTTCLSAVLYISNTSEMTQLSGRFITKPIFSI